MSFGDPVKGRADTDEKKRKIMLRLLRAWRASPELRLGQLISNANAPHYHEAITVRVSDAQMRALEGAARKAGTKLSTWARETLLAAAGAA